MKNGLKTFTLLLSYFSFLLFAGCAAHHCPAFSSIEHRSMEKGSPSQSYSRAGGTGRVSKGSGLARASGTGRVSKGSGLALWGHSGGGRSIARGSFLSNYSPTSHQHTIEKGSAFEGSFAKDDVHEHRPLTIKFTHDKPKKHKDGLWPRKMRMYPG